MMTTPEDTDDAFFDALLAADTEALEQLLAQDFLIVDIARGGITDREAFIAAIGSSLAEFAAIDVADRTTRDHGNAAVIVGRTRMRGSIAGERFSVESRYTHVLVADGGAWRLASVQGTRIADHEQQPSQGTLRSVSH
jgi:ketosteroid isomerase-like protein